MLDAHNVEHALSRQLNALSRLRHGPLYRLYARRETAARRREEVSICRSMDAVVTVSEVDASALRRQFPGSQPVVVPNGVHLARLDAERRTRKQHAKRLFFGKLDYRPERRRPSLVLHAILPRFRTEIPDFELVVVGSGDPRPTSQSVAPQPGSPIRRTSRRRPAPTSMRLGSLSRRCEQEAERG